MITKWPQKKSKFEIKETNAPKNSRSSHTHVYTDAQITNLQAKVPLHTFTKPLKTCLSASQLHIFTHKRKFLHAWKCPLNSLHLPLHHSPAPLLVFCSASYCTLHNGNCQCRLKQKYSYNYRLSHRKCSCACFMFYWNIPSFQKVGW